MRTALVLLATLTILGVSAANVFVRDGATVSPDLASISAPPPAGLTLDNLPPGKWTLACGPDKARGALVDLFKVATDAGKGLTTTDVWLENRTKQVVAGVKISWKLYEKSHPDLTLLNGETPQFIAVTLSPGEKRIVTYPVVSFAKIYGPLLRGNELEGRYKIELRVSNIRYDDGAGNNQFVKVASRIAPPADEGCQHQECGWSQADHCEKCYGEQGSTCSWSDCTHCQSGRCPGLID